jgi:hypothetical protein
MALEPAKVLTRATLRAAEMLGLDNLELARTIGMAVDQVDLLRSAELLIQPVSSAGQRSLLIIRLQVALAALLGEDQIAGTQWLRTNNKAIGGIPLDTMSLEAGLTRVVAQLERYLQGA